MPNENNVLDSDEHAPVTVLEPQTDSPNNSQERSEGDLTNESSDSDHPYEGLSDHGQAVQPATLSSSNEPVLAITPPSTDLDFASWMPTGAIAPSWSDCMTTRILAGDPLPDNLDQVALDMDLGPSYNGVWQYMANSPGIGAGLESSRFPAPTVDCVAVTPQGHNSSSSPSPLAVGLNLLPIESASSSAPSYEHNIWVVPLPSRIPALPIRDRIYLAHFTSHVIHIMPGQVKFLRDMCMESEPIRTCANALAAANLANRGGKFSNDGRGHWIAMQPHHGKALGFASRGIAMIQSGSGISLACRVN
ncbi:hypothetical protein BHE90_010274 [Fusarium euwallaceae]|uniref:Uncharacterized protein n=1 Tax=Fusarium euwallaceae TaxID=1147111 RepID=A0A430LHQ6_9HYPO|nr:hypothetical protein BHE90_010274 [Fusarium euwallaceae]